MKKLAKMVGKIILILLVGIVLLVINSSILNKIPFGITLPVGWLGTCYYYEYTGFPFSVISIPPPGMLCLASFNIIGYVLNFAFLILLTYIFYIIFRKTITRR